MKIIKVRKVPLSPLKPPQVRSSANSVRVTFAPASQQARDCFNTCSTFGRFGFDHSLATRQTTTEQIPKLSRLSPEAISKLSRSITEQLSKRV